MKINFILGTAAELIKVYPVIEQSLKRNHQVQILATGQARQNFLAQYKDFGLSPDILQFALNDTTDLERSGAAFKWFLRSFFLSRSRLRYFLRSTIDPSVAIVHGDTLSTLVGAVWAWRAKVPLFHVEAGLRSSSLWQPFPEEICRRLVSRLTKVHFPPDEKAASHLQNTHGVVINTNGNTLIDAVRFLHSQESKSLFSMPYVVVNVHRFENLQSASRWRLIVDTVLAAAQENKVIFVMHPQTRHRLEQDERALKAFTLAKIEIRDRMTFAQFITLIKHCRYLISDGGSNQEECSYMGIPCLLLRETTERFEGLEQNVLLSQFDKRKIENFLRHPEAFKRPPLAMDVKGPTDRILNAIDEWQGKAERQLNKIR